MAVAWSWAAFAAQQAKDYRCWLYAEAVERRDDSGKVTKPGYRAAQSDEVWREQGRLAHAVLVKIAHPALYGRRSAGFPGVLGESRHVETLVLQHRR